MFITSQTPSREFLLRVSYLEIYNEVWASFHPLKLFIWWCTSTTVHFMLLMYVLMCKFVCMHYNFVVLPSEFCVATMYETLYMPLDWWWMMDHSPQRKCLSSIWTSKDSLFYMRYSCILTKLSIFLSRNKHFIAMK